MSKSNSVIDHIIGKGSVTKTLIDKTTGEVVKEFTDHNLIVKTGRSALIKLIAGTWDSSVTKMAIGEGGTADLEANAFKPIAPVDGEEALKTERARVHSIDANVNLNETNPKVTFVGLFDCANVNALINECGLFFADDTTMFARHTFDTVSLRETSNFSLQISWTIEF